MDLERKATRAEWSRRMMLSLAGAAAVFAAGCAALPSQIQAQPAEQAVEDRSEARAQALIQRDVEKLYGFTTPAYRERVSLQAYRQAQPVRLLVKDAEVKAVHCPTATRCDVRASWTYEMKGGSVGEVTTMMSERWIKADGQWWYFEDKK